MASRPRPPLRWSIVMAVIARVAGGRAESCDTAVPSWTCEVRDPHQASGVHASLPQGSAVRRSSSRCWWRSSSVAFRRESRTTPTMVPARDHVDPAAGLGYLRAMSTWIVREAAPGAGLRVAVKDIIDVAGLPTTAACRAVAERAEPAAADAAC